jgi:hypothetical protein
MRAVAEPEMEEMRVFFESGEEMDYRYFCPCGWVGPFPHADERVNRSWEECPDCGQEPPFHPCSSNTLMYCFVCEHICDMSDCAIMALLERVCRSCGSDLVHAMLLQGDEEMAKAEQAIRRVVAGESSVFCSTSKEWVALWYAASSAVALF